MDLKDSMESPKIKVQKLKKTFLDFRLGFWDIEVYTKRSPSTDIWEGLWILTKGLLKDPRHCKLTWHGKILPRSKENQCSVTYGSEHHMLDSASITEEVTEPEKPADLTSRATHCQSGHNAFSHSSKFTKTSSLLRSTTETWKWMPFLWWVFIWILKFQDNCLKKIRKCAGSDSTFSWERFLVKSLRMSKYTSVFLKDGS